MLQETTFCRQPKLQTAALDSSSWNARSLNMTIMQDCALRMTHMCPALQSWLKWASENGIVGGYGSGRFGPDDAVTREQMVTIFFRYAQFKGLGVSSAESLDRYSDCALVSAYARPAMAWAVGCGLVKGSGGSLLPGSPASRAQAAVILQRFSQNVAK